MVAAHPFGMEVTPGPTIRQRPIQYPPDQRKWVREQTDALLEKGVIGPAPPDAHLHRIILVEGRPDRPAQSGQDYRLCTDFRAINARTKVDGFPAPDLAECLRRLHNSSCFSSIDLKAGYHNVPVKDSCKRFCGFITQDGAYCYERL